MLQFSTSYEILQQAPLERYQSYRIVANTTCQSRERVFKVFYNLVCRQSPSFLDSADFCNAHPATFQNVAFIGNTCEDYVIIGRTLSSNNFIYRYIDQLIYFYVPRMSDADSICFLAFTFSSRVTFCFNPFFFDFLNCCFQQRVLCNSLKFINFEFG